MRPLTLREELLAADAALRPLASDGDLAAAFERLARVVPPARIIGIRVSVWRRVPEGEGGYLRADWLLDYQRAGDWFDPDGPRDAFYGFETRSTWSRHVGGELAYEPGLDPAALSSGPLRDVLRVQDGALVTATVPRARGVSWVGGPEPLRAREGDVEVRVALAAPADVADLVGEFVRAPTVE